MTFDIAPWFITIIVAVGLGPWIAATGVEPKVGDAVILTFICAFSPAIVAEIAGRVARRPRSAVSEMLLMYFCYIAPAATAAAIYFGKLPSLLAARYPDWPSCVHLAAALAPGAFAVIATILSEQRLFALARYYESPRAADRARMALLPLLLPFAVAGGFDILNLSQRFRNYYESYAFVQLATLLLVAGLMLILFPRFVYFAVRTRPVEDGPLLDTFKNIAKNARVRVRDFRVALTGNTVSNAALLGGLGPRRVLLTDRILLEHPPDELVAVVGHELGHASGGHLRLFAIFLGSLAVWILNIPPSWLEPIGEWGTLAIGLALVFVILKFGLGAIARYCEHDADLAGAAAAGSPEPLANSLRRICGPNRLDAASWRHPSVNARIAFLQKAAADPNIAKRQKQILRRVEIVSFVILIFGAGLAVWRGAEDFPRERAVFALRSSDFAKANEIIAKNPSPEMAPLSKLAIALARTGGAGDVSLRERSREALLRADYEEASAFARLAAMRSGRTTDAHFADIAEALLEGNTSDVEVMLAGPASFLSRDARLGPAIRRAVEEIATKPTSAPGKNRRSSG